MPVSRSENPKNYEGLPAGIDRSPLTPRWRRVDLTDLQNGVMIVSRNEKGPHNLPQALQKITPNKEKQEAIKRRILAAGYTTDLFRDGDSLLFQVQGSALVIEKAGHKYVIPLVDKDHEKYPAKTMKKTDRGTYERKDFSDGNEYILLEEGEDNSEKIKIKTRRAWQTLKDETEMVNQVADQGSIYRMLKLFGLDPRDWQSRRKIWDDMSSAKNIDNVTAQLRKQLKDHPKKELREIDAGFLTKRYTGDQLQNRAMIEYLRWKYLSGEGVALKKEKVREKTPEEKSLDAAYKHLNEAYGVIFGTLTLKGKITAIAEVVKDVKPRIFKTVNDVEKMRLSSEAFKRNVDTFGTMLLGFLNSLKQNSGHLKKAREALPPRDTISDDERLKSFEETYEKTLRATEEQMKKIGDLLIYLQGHGFAPEKTVPEEAKGKPVDKGALKHFKKSEKAKNFAAQSELSDIAIESGAEEMRDTYMIRTKKGRYLIEKYNGTYTVSDMDTRKNIFGYSDPRKPANPEPRSPKRYEIRAAILAYEAKSKNPLERDTELKPHFTAEQRKIYNADKQYGF